MNATKNLFEEALIAELVIADPEIALWLASCQARRSGRPVRLPTLSEAFTAVDAAMSALPSHEDRN